MTERIFTKPDRFLNSLRGSRLFAALLAAAVAALLATFALASSASAAPRQFFSVSPQTGLTTEDLDRMGQGNVGAVRIFVNWAAIQAIGPDAYNWSSIDGVVIQAARNGVKVLPFLYGSPDWVARGLDGYSCTSKCVNFAPRSKAARKAWQNFVGAAVDRYGPDGSLWTEFPDVPKKPIRAWQIWNEQNSKTFYKPKPKPKAYAKLLDGSAKAINSRDRGADIILGGMAGLEGSKKAVTAWDYLGKLYDRKGVKKDFDGVAPHPYGARLGKVTQQIDRFRAEMKKARDAGAQMWVTELGWGSSKGRNPLNRGLNGQAKRLKQAYKYFLKKRGKLNVKTVTWFSWKDYDAEICDWCANSGLFHADLQPKPSWNAFTKFTGGS